jgi:hypothetical protein
VRVRHATIATGAALVLSLAGCRQVLDTTGYGTGPAPTYAGRSDGVLYVSQSCRDCVDAECHTEAAACAADPACAAKAQCLALCAHDGHACRGKCNLSIPDTREMRALVQCEAVHDNCSECGSSRAVWSGEACDACLATTCPAALDAFSRDSAALERRACEEGCPDPNAPPYCGCRGEAGGNTDAGTGTAMDAGEQQVLTQAQSCANGGRCRARCGKDVPDWNCLGSVKWPAPAATLTDLELHIRLVDAAIKQNTPLRNETVKTCSDLGGDCETNYLDSKTTQENGWAPPLGLGLFATGDHFVGHLSIPDALLYLFPPVRESPTWRQFRVLSRAVADGTAPLLTSADGKPVTLEWADRGGIAWSIVACNQAPAAGVSVTVDSGQPAFYSAVETQVPKTGTETTSAAVGVFINVPHGQRRVTAKLAGQLIGTYSVEVRIGSITHLTMVPTPESG